MLKITEMDLDLAQRDVEAVVAFWARRGIIVTVQTAPLMPPRMGYYNLQINIRPGHGVEVM